MLLEELETTVMFSVIADTIPDVSHQDRLTVNVCYVNDKGVPVERFLQMIELTKLEKGMQQKLLKFSLKIV